MWDPGTSRVAPLASVKSVSAHMVLQTVAGWGLGSGMTWSSAWIGWAVSPGPMAIEESDDTSSPGSSTPSTDRQDRRVHRDPREVTARGRAGCRCGRSGCPRRCWSAGTAPSRSSSRSSSSISASISAEARRRPRRWCSRPRRSRQSASAPRWSSSGLLSFRGRESIVTLWPARSDMNTGMSCVTCALAAAMTWSAAMPATVTPEDALIVREADGVRWCRCLRCDAWIAGAVARASFDRSGVHPGRDRAAAAGPGPARPVRPPTDRARPGDPRGRPDLPGRRAPDLRRAQQGAARRLSEHHERA